MLFGLPLSIHEPTRTSTPSNCYGLIRIGSTATRLAKCLAIADISCAVILPGQNMIQLQPQHISTQLKHDCHLNWSAWLNRHLSLEHLPKLLRPPVVFFRFVCFPAGVALTFVWNTKGSLDKYKLSVCILFTWRQWIYEIQFLLYIAEFPPRLFLFCFFCFFCCLVNKFMNLLLVQVWRRRLWGEKRSHRGHHDLICIFLELQNLRLTSELLPLLNWLQTHLSAAADGPSLSRTKSPTGGWWCWVSLISRPGKMCYLVQLLPKAMCAPLS